MRCWSTQTRGRLSPAFPVLSSLPSPLGTDRGCRAGRATGLQAEPGAQIVSLQLLAQCWPGQAADTSSALHEGLHLLASPGLGSHNTGHTLLLLIGICLLFLLEEFVSKTQQADLSRWPFPSHLPRSCIRDFIKSALMGTVTVPMTCHSKWAGMPRSNTSSDVIWKGPCWVVGENITVLSRGLMGLPGDPEGPGWHLHPFIAIQKPHLQAGPV